MSLPLIRRKSGTVPRCGAAVIVDADSTTREHLREMLEEIGLPIREARNVLQLQTLVGLGLMRHEPQPSVILLVMREPMPMLERLCRSYVSEWDIPLVAITAFGPAEAATRADGLGALVICDRPFDLQRCRTEVAAVLAAIGSTPLAEVGEGT